MGSYKWSYKSPNVGHNYSSPNLSTPFLTAHESSTGCVSPAGARKQHPSIENEEVDETAGHQDQHK